MPAGGGSASGGNYTIKDIKLAAQGEKNLAWAAREMPVVASIRKDFEKTKPFKGTKIAACLHITKETGVLLLALKAGGAEVSGCGSNPLSTQDDVAAALAKNGIQIHAARGVNNKEYYQNVNSALDLEPDIVIDDGADLITMVHTRRTNLLAKIKGGMEETTTGVIRLKAMAAEQKLKFPVIAVNDSETKHLFDNYYGTGQSTIDGIVRATNVMLAGKTVTVAGYGDCGAGIAKVLRGLGSRVIVTEINPVRALKAVMDGFSVAPMTEAVKISDLFITVTGNINVITLKHVQAMKDGAIICNSGHFNVEIAVDEINKATKTTQIRDNMVEHKLKNGKSVFVLAEGRLVNLAAAEGHPSAVMDTSFANQALASQYILKNHTNLSPDVHILPTHLDQKIADIKLGAMNIKFDKLTKEQAHYLSSWSHGT